MMNVFLVETPHQLLNAIEAKDFFCLLDNRLVVVLLENYPEEAYRPLVMDSGWDAVHYIPSRTNGRSAILSILNGLRWDRARGYYETYEIRQLRRTLDEYAGGLAKVRKLFVGNYLIDYMRHFSNVMRHEELILLDDGTATIRINNELRRGVAADSASSIKPFKQKFIERLIGLRALQADAVTFFTTYDLSAKPGDRVIKNEYNYLRSRASNSEQNGQVFFLGMTLIDEGFSDAAYYQYLRKAIDYFPDSEFVYIPHKCEPPERVNFISKELGVKTRRFNVPIEYQLTMRGEVPLVLASFFSSALENCRIIFNNTLRIISFYINPELFPINTIFVKDVYDYYESRVNDTFQLVRL